ncbi:MAG: hypothetical protein WC551_13770 [Patescibacteria group bacterium]|jgi:hypothetical protein
MKTSINRIYKRNVWRHDWEKMREPIVRGMGCRVVMLQFPVRVGKKLVVATAVLDWREAMNVGLRLCIESRKRFSKKRPNARLARKEEAR